MFFVQFDCLDPPALATYEFRMCERCIYEFPVSSTTTAEQSARLGIPTCRVVGRYGGPRASGEVRCDWCGALN